MQRGLVVYFYIEDGSVIPGFFEVFRLKEGRRIVWEGGSRMIHKRRNMLILLALAAVMLFPAGAFGATKKVMTHEDIYKWSSLKEDWVLYWAEEYSYTSKGNVLRQKTTSWNDEGDVLLYTEEVVRSYKSGKLIQESLYYNNKLDNTKTYTYYTKGKTKGKLNKITAKKGKKTLYTTTYQYNTKGYLTSIVTKAGKVTEKTKVKQIYKKGILRKETHTDEYLYSKEWTYDSKGRLTTYHTVGEGAESTTTYYPNGNPRVKTSVAYEGGHERITERYFKDGMLKSYKWVSTEDDSDEEYYPFSREEEGDKVTVTAPGYEMHVATFKNIKF